MGEAGKDGFGLHLGGRKQRTESLLVVASRLHAGSGFLPNRALQFAERPHSGERRFCLLLEPFLFRSVRTASAARCRKGGEQVDDRCESGEQAHG